MMKRSKCARRRRRFCKEDKLRSRDTIMKELHCGTCKMYLPLGVAKMIAGSEERKAKRTGKAPVMTTFSVYNLERNNQFDYSKARRELGYRTRPYAETLRDEAKWLKAAGMV